MSLTGRFATVAACDEATGWTASVVVPLSLFKGRAAALLTGGRAVITATASAVDDETGESIRSHAAAAIVLRGSW